MCLSTPVMMMMVMMMMMTVMIMIMMMIIIIIIKQEVEKILNNKGLIIEIQCMWDMRAEVLSVITGTPRTIS